MSYLLPQSFDEINDTLKEKIKQSYGINDAQYQGSNIAVLANIFSYAISMINANMNFGINETMISKAQSKKNIITLARELGYEPQRKKSFKYRIRLKAKRTGLIMIPTFSKFTDGEKNFVYIDNDYEAKFGESSNVFVFDKEKFTKDITARKGNVAGTLLVTEDNEVVEVLEKVDAVDVKRLLLNNISGNEDFTEFSKTSSSFYKYDESSKTYTKLAEIEAMVLNEENPDDPEFIIQLKNLSPTDMPTSESDAKQIKYFTDDITFNYKGSNFEGFVPSSYNENSEVIKFKVKDNKIQIDGKDILIQDLITLFRKKRIALINEENPDGGFLEKNIVCSLQDMYNLRETTIDVVQGDLISYEDNPDLQVLVDKEMEDRGYVVLDYTDVEQNGIFLGISRVNYNNELILNQKFYQRDTHLAPKVFQGEDNSFLVLQDYFDNNNEYLKVYTEYASTGTKFYQGNIFYFKLLLSLGSQGAAKGLMTAEDLADDFDVIPYETSDTKENTIDNLLIATGSDEESIEEIRKNAPLYHNLAQRLVTKHDYKTFCSSSFQFIEQSQVWGGEELDSGKRLGHVFFSFIPKSRITDFTADENNVLFTLNNFGNRDVFFVPENQILLKEDGGIENSVFETLSKNKIITLQYHNVPPIYLDFSIKVRIIKYMVGKSDKELRFEVFKAIRKYFNEVEKFDSEIFESNLIKYIDREFNNETGIQLKAFLETSIEKEDFAHTGYAEEEKESKTYSAEFLFQFPINGIFTDDIYSYTGEVIENGKLMKEKLPNLKVEHGFIEKGDKIFFDYDNILYYKNVNGIITEFSGNVENIDSSVKSFLIPLMLDTRNISPSSSLTKELKQIGNLKVYTDSSMIYIEINATDSTHSKDLAKRLPINYFDEIKTFLVETDTNMILKRNTFPRLKKVEIVEEL